MSQCLFGGQCGCNARECYDKGTVFCLNALLAGSAVATGTAIMSSSGTRCLNALLAGSAVATSRSRLNSQAWRLNALLAGSAVATSRNGSMPNVCRVSMPFWRAVRLQLEAKRIERTNKRLNALLAGSAVAT